MSPQSQKAWDVLSHFLGEHPNYQVNADATSSHLKEKNELAGPIQRDDKVEDRGFMRWTLMSAEHRSKAQSACHLGQEHSFRSSIYSGFPALQHSSWPHLVWLEML